MKITTYSSKWFSIFLLFSLVLNGLLPFFSTASLLHQANNDKIDDVVLICTGNSFKWASRSHFVETGQLKYIDAPVGNDDTPKHSNCPLGLNNDHNVDDDIMVVSLLTNHLLFEQLVKRSYILDIEHKRFSFNLSRAPPLVS